MLHKYLLPCQIIVVAAICFLGCNAPTKPEAKPETTYRCSFDFNYGFDQSRTILRVNDTTLMDSSITSHVIPNSGYSYAASTTDILLKHGSYQMHVEVEGIVKDTVLDVNDTLFNYISFVKDSSKIYIITQNHGIIIM
ncbi:MAG: hypothetical protein ABSF80_04385 [Chitinispirillaceae bacterium]|jgi:hypothetical protein